MRVLHSGVCIFIIATLAGVFQRHLSFLVDIAKSNLKKMSNCCIKNNESDLLSVFWGEEKCFFITHDYHCCATVCDNAAGQCREMGTGFLCDAHFSIISFKCPWCFCRFNII